MSSEIDLEPEAALPFDVVMDLLPLYRAGGLRPGTRQAIRDHLASHPELEALAAIMGDAPAPAPDMEHRSLRRTHRLLALQRWLFGLAIGAFALAFSLQIERWSDGRPRVQLLLLAHPAWVAPVIPAGAAFLAGYFYLRRRIARGG